MRPSRRARVATATIIHTIAVEATIAIVCLKVFWFLIIGYCEHVTTGLYSLLALHMSHRLNSYSIPLNNPCNTALYNPIEGV